MNRLMLGPCTAFSRCSRTSCAMCCNIQVACKQTCVDFQEKAITILGESSHLSESKWCAKWQISACHLDPQKYRHSHIFKGGLGYYNTVRVLLCPLVLATLVPSSLTTSCQSLHFFAFSGPCSLLCPLMWQVRGIGEWMPVAHNDDWLDTTLFIGHLPSLPHFPATLQCFRQPTLKSATCT